MCFSHCILYMLFVSTQMSYPYDYNVYDSTYHEHMIELMSLQHDLRYNGHVGVLLANAIESIPNNEYLFSDFVPPSILIFVGKSFV
mmetsp:Transcript_25410/g.59517  ORF Transcript_25410/g.59517 Transcript_25410/m.59517 type:complete len:86 (-) Transcript_25410:668-925(-)